MTFFHIPDQERRAADHEGGPGPGSALLRAGEAAATGDLSLLRRVIDFMAVSVADGSFGDLLAQYLKLVRPLGFAHVGMVDMALVGPSPAAGLCFTTFPIDIVTRFANGPRWLNDPVWQAATAADRMFRWSDVAKNPDPAADNLFHRIEGFVDGLTIPVTTPHLRHASVFLAADRAFELDETAAEALRVASTALAVRSPRVHLGNCEPQRLTDRERQVLAQTAFGKSAREIAIDLRMSEKTVARHLLNIRGKLGAANTVQAVVLALRHAQISF